MTQEEKWWIGLPKDLEIDIEIENCKIIKK
jgi:hypothetical protein